MSVALHKSILLKVRLVLLALACFIAFAPASQADDIRPLYIEISEHQPQVYRLQWRVPPMVPVYNIPVIAMPDDCTVAGNVAQRPAHTGQRLYRCEQPLAGEIISFQYPHTVPALSTIFKYNTLSGEHHTKLLAPAENSWPIPTAETVTSVAKDYTLLGMEHIWMGMDHLLFVVCLLWIAGTGRRMLITITGFTIAHSVTLFLSALNVIRVPVPPVEAVIALSIVFLAVEIAKHRPDHKEHSLTWRYPITVSSSFGLLHGFGFAAALAEIGLPQTELVTGLLFFNVGVEIGQVLFAAGIIALMAIARWLTSHRLSTASTQATIRQVSSYVVGIIASYWLIERTTGFL